jgi:molecular chaperone HscA
LARFSLKGIPRMPAGLARLEVEFFVDENNLLKVEARELTTGITQKVEVQPSYGLTDEQVEEMLLDALDHGEEDFEARRLADARVEAERILLATQKAVASDADLLEKSECERVDNAMADLREAIDTAKKAARVQLCIDALDDATHDWAGRRMNRAIQTAIAGKEVGSIEKTVERAKGVDAHVEDHTRAREERH